MVNGGAPELSAAAVRAAGRRLGFRWVICTLLFLATVINYLDRQTLSVLAPFIRAELKLSEMQYSQILFWFFLGYSIMQTLGGRLVDWVGLRFGFVLLVVWWSAAAIGHSIANNMFLLSLMRFLLAMGEAGNWPAAVKTISEWFPSRERAFAAGFFNSGSSIGALIAPPLVAWLVLSWGWRAAFLVTGSLGFIWVILWLWLYSRPEECRFATQSEREYIRKGTSIADSSGPFWSGMLVLIRFPQTWGLILSRFVSDPVWWFYVFWLPEYLAKTRGFDLALIGMVGWIPFLTADLGNLVGGAASSILISRGVSTDKARKTVIVISMLLMLAGIPAATTKSASLSLALISVCTFAFSAWAANLLALPSDIFPRAYVATVTGFSGTGAAIGGMLFSLLTGYVVQHYSYTPVFVAAGFLPLVAAGLILVLVPRVPDQPPNALAELTQQG